MNDTHFQLAVSQSITNFIPVKYKTEEGAMKDFSVPEIQVHVLIRSDRCIYHEDPKKCPRFEVSF